jgi:hypothetical protein
MPLRYLAKRELRGASLPRLHSEPDDPGVFGDPHARIVTLTRRTKKVHRGFGCSDFRGTEGVK